MGWWATPKVRAVGVGLRNGCIIVALTLANAAIQTFRHSHGAAARPLVAFSYLWAAASVLLVFLPGLLVARRFGSLKLGLYTGAGIGVAPGIGVLVLTALRMSSHPAQYATPSDPIAYAIIGTILGCALVLAACMSLGAFLSLPGALIGRSQWRRQHPSLPSFVVEHTSPSLAAALSAAQTGFVASGDAGASPAPREISGDTKPPIAHTMPTATVSEVRLYQSMWRGLLFLATAALLAIGSVAMIVSSLERSSVAFWQRIPVIVLGVAGTILFGVGTPLFGLRMLLVRPLLCATQIGIEYRGYRFPWSCKVVPWEQVVMLTLGKPAYSVFGKYELTIDILLPPYTI